MNADAEDNIDAPAHKFDPMTGEPITPAVEPEPEEYVHPGTRLKELEAQVSRILEHLDPYGTSHKLRGAKIESGKAVPYQAPVAREVFT